MRFRFRPYAEDKGAMDGLKQARLELLGQITAAGATSRS